MKPGYPGGGPVQLEVDIASKAYTNAAGERHDVLADISFALGAGEVGVFVGPSGCGKSTMLQIFAGLDHDYQGRVSRPAGARIGMVFQDRGCCPGVRSRKMCDWPRRWPMKQSFPRYSQCWN